MTCEDVRALSPELALGVLDARQRATTLAHLHECPPCRRETASFAEVADILVGLTPPVEPPPGFELRALQAIGERRGPSQLRRAARSSAGAWIAAAVAMAMLLAGVGGWTLAFRQATTRSVVAATTAVLTDHGHVVGHVLLATGAGPWVAIAIDGDIPDESVQCQVRTRNGRTIPVGSFALRGGYGYWAAPIPPGADAVASVVLVGADGAVIGEARLRSS